MTTPLPPTDPSATDAHLPGEAELAALYRQLPQSEPGPALDAAVLRAAAQALENADDQPRIERRKGPREPGDWVHPKPASGANVGTLPSITSGIHGPRRRTSSWLIALGSAASLVLVAGLAWHMRTAPAAGPVQVSSMAPPQAATAMAPEAKRLAGTMGSESTATEGGHEAVEAQPGVPARSAVVANMPSTSTKPLATPPGVKAQPSLGSAAVVPEKVRAMQPMGTGAARRVVQPPPPVQELSAPPIPVSAQALAPPAPVSQMVAANDSADNAAAGSPAQELTRIQQLFAQGHDDEARRRLRDFRHAHPQWPLPPTLQAQLPKP